MRQPQTSFAPAGRKSHEELIQEYELITSNKLAISILDSIPTLLLVLNKERQVVFSNKAFLKLLNINSIDLILGKRTGEILGCPSVLKGADGCGTSKDCQVCGAIKSIMNCIEGNSGSEECTIKAGPTAMMHLKVTSEPIKFGDQDFILFNMQDISNEKKKVLLERIFYHDILNAAHNINSIAELFSTEEDVDRHEEYLGLMLKVTGNLIDEINTQRIISNSDYSNFISQPSLINSFSFYKDLKSEFESVTNGKLTITLDQRSENFSFNADKVLLKRVVANMMTNAIEAENNEGTVSIGIISLNEKGSMIWVHNQSYMTEDVQLQVFNRSFSTKGSDRGLGTYSMKTLTEKYMKGKISFTSSPTNGTTFIIEIPGKV